MVVVQEYGIAHDSGRALVAVVEGLDVGKQHQYQQCLLKNVGLAIHQVAGIRECFPDLEFVFERQVVRARNTDPPPPDVPIHPKIFDEDAVDIFDTGHRQRLHIAGMLQNEIEGILEVEQHDGFFQRFAVGGFALLQQPFGLQQRVGIPLYSCRLPAEVYREALLSLA